MKLSKRPDRYSLVIANHKINVLSNDGTPHFTRYATAKKPKIYVVSKAGELLYVGITRQAISSRLRLGLKADGSTGYHGYAFCKKNHTVRLDIWYLEGCKAGGVDLETIEAEIVYEYRKRSDQWPLSQTEIHFHRSLKAHRLFAKKILDTIKGGV